MGRLVERLVVVDTENLAPVMLEPKPESAAGNIGARTWARTANA